MTAKARRLGPAEVHLVGGVLGLVSEGDRVADMVREARPDVVAVGVSPGELDALLRIAAGEVEEDMEVPVSFADEAYAHHLSRYGRVELPPPVYLAAVRAAVELEVPVEALDMEEDAYTDAFTDHVGAIDLMRKGRRERILAKRGVEADTPAAFADAWERQLLRIGGLADLEAAREAHMADRLRALCEGADGTGPGRVLAVVASVREAGIVERLWPGEAAELRGRGEGPGEGGGLLEGLLGR